MALVEPRQSADYDDRTTEAVRSVLFEIGQILGSYHGTFAVIGGSVPWLLLEDAEMAHVGTADAGLSLYPEALGDGECAQLVESLQRHNCHQRGSLRRFPLVRTVSAHGGGPDIDVPPINGGRIQSAGSGLGWEHETPCLGASLTMEASWIVGSDSPPV